MLVFADVSHGLHVRGGIVGYGLHPLALQFDERLFLVGATDSVVGLEDDGAGEVRLVDAGDRLLVDTGAGEVFLVDVDVESLED